MTLKQNREYITQCANKDREAAKKTYEEALCIINAKFVNAMNELNRTCLEQNGRHSYVNGFCNLCGKSQFVES